MTRRSLVAASLASRAALAQGPKPLEFQIQWVNPPKEETPRVSHHVLRSASMGHDVGFNLYLPPGYDSSGERYPVLYWLHGAGSNESAGVANATLLDRAIADKLVPPAIMVIPNGGRRSEYRDWKPQKVMSETHIIRELIPHVDATYRTVAGREGRHIEGMSMGGNGSLKLAFKHPGLFASVVAYAGSYRPLPKDGNLYNGIPADAKTWVGQLAHWYSADDDVFALSVRNAEALKLLRIRLVIGTADVSFEDSEVLHAHLRKVGIVHEYEIALGIPHNTTAYYQRVGVEGFRFHFPGWK